MLTVYPVQSETEPLLLRTDLYARYRDRWLANALTINDNDPIYLYKASNTIPCLLGRISIMSGAPLEANGRLRLVLQGPYHSDEILYNQYLRGDFPIPKLTWEEAGGILTPRYIPPGTALYLLWNSDSPISDVAIHVLSSNLSRGPQVKPQGGE